jgi:GNAT superfamily N-acetyltransferase
VFSPRSARAHDAVTIELATQADVIAILGLRASVAADQTRRFGPGHWSSVGTERGVARELLTSKVLVARDRRGLVGSLRLATRKPWAIRPEFFTPVVRPIYLVDMAVAPSHQRQGIGGALIDEAVTVASAWPGDAIRLDAYDLPVGAGPFYAKCGFEEVGRATYRGTPLVYYQRLLASARG